MSKQSATPSIGDDGLPFPQTFDAMAWAKEFNKRFTSVSVDEAIGWFANAIMRGHDTHAERQLTAQGDGARREDVLGAVARGWCSEKNKHKTMDADLAEAITDEVLALRSPAARSATPVDVIAAILGDYAELPDKISPTYCPEEKLVTADELRKILSDRLQGTPVFAVKDSDGEIFALGVSSQEVWQVSAWLYMAESPRYLIEKGYTCVPVLIVEGSG